MELRPILFITLDSCRYDTFAAAKAPHLKQVGRLYCAHSPSYFTYGSHAAMFVGFTPGNETIQESFVNPKFGKIFKMRGAVQPGWGRAYLQLEGRSIMEGLRRKGYHTLGTSSIGWFNTGTPTGRVLTEDFNEFYFSKPQASLPQQIAWLRKRMRVHRGQPLFVFMNIGETHTPYYYEGAPWDGGYNPCLPFRPEQNNAEECRRRQLGCVEYVDRVLADFLEEFRDGSVIVCGDHGDCWGEDGLWEHGIFHPKVFEVPLLFRLHGEA